jgi:hypothetical protein
LEEYPEDMKIFNLSYRDPNGNPASAYIVRTLFSDGSHSDGLYCANTKEKAFEEVRREREEQSKKWFPGREITGMELLSIDGGIKDGRQVV